MSDGFGKKLLNLSLPYFRSEERWRARFLLLVIILINIGMVALSIRITYWFNDFYDALQLLDKKAFFYQLKIFTVLAFANIVLAIYQYYFTQKLQIKWRHWLTENYLSQWLDKHAYYRTQLLFPNSTDNPDQRISEDVNLFTASTLSLSTGLLNAICMLLAFSALLWKLSGTLAIPFGSTTLHIPGYMLYAALIYASLGTWLTYKIGKPLVQLSYNQQRYEADFRFSMVRLRENSESIALYHGEASEHSNFSQGVKQVVANYIRIIKKQKQLITLNVSYNQLAIIFPVLVAAPRFFAKQIMLGGLLQIMKAFGYVHDSLSYIANSFTSIAEWKAVVNRLIRFTDTLQNTKTIQQTENIHYKVATNAALRVAALNIQIPNGATLIKDLNFELKPGTRLLIRGASGSGKSTLIRALAGIWPFGSGTVIAPNGLENFIPQKVYLPTGTLRQVLNYPIKSDADENHLQATLSLCKLNHLLPQIEQTANWYQILSLGEQQRIAFARMLLQKSACIFLDEVTASLDEENEATLYQNLIQNSPQAIIVSVGHRSSLREFHNVELRLLGNGEYRIEPI